MIIECLDGGIVRVSDPDDFGTFKVILRSDVDMRTHAWQGITLLDERHALVAIDLVPALADRARDAAWNQRYAEMIAKAERHGWIDALQNAIRAHIKRSPETQR